MAGTQAGRLSPIETIEKDHGRLELRRYFLSNQIDGLPERSNWRELCAVGMVEAPRDIGSQVSVERRYFLCSFNDLDHFAGVVRAHGSIENSQHWVLMSSSERTAPAPAQLMPRRIWP